MYWTKLKLVAVAVVVILTGSAAWVSQATAQKPGGRVSAEGFSTLAKVADPDSSRDAAIDVEMLERAWAGAIPGRDASIVNRILADDFENVDALGIVFSKETYLSHLRNGAFSTQSRRLHELKARVFGETVVATSRVTIETVPAPLSQSHVYVRRQGRWQCVAAHESWLSGIIRKPTDTPELGGDGLRDQPAKSSTTARSAAQRDQAVMNCTFCHLMNQPLAVDPNHINFYDPHHYDPYHTAGFKAESITEVRPPFECLVRRIHASERQAVKKGDPLFELISNELAEAKTRYEKACIRWTHDKRALDLKMPVARDMTVPPKDLAEVINLEVQSRLEMKIAKNKLLSYGLTEDEIKRIPQEEVGSRARFTIRSPVNGIVTKLVAEPGWHYNDKNLLMVIGSITPTKPDDR